MRTVNLGTGLCGSIQYFALDKSLRFQRNNYFFVAVRTAASCHGGLSILGH